MGLYPLPMRFPVPMDGSAGRAAREAGRELQRGEYIDVVITQTGWRFGDDDSIRTFSDLPIADRLSYRKAFEAQVSLAKDTPKGDS